MTTMIDASAPRGFRITGWHVLAMVTAFFVVVIAVDSWFAVLAYRTFPGEVSVTPYEDGLLYNKKIAQIEAQTKLGWQAAAQAQPGSVMIEYRDAKGQAVRGLTVTGRMERPATETGRIVLKFAETSPGVYVATTGKVSGAWDLTAEAKAATGASFEAERRLTWP